MSYSARVGEVDLRFSCLLARLCLQGKELRIILAASINKPTVFKSSKLYLVIGNSIYIERGPAKLVNMLLDFDN